MRDAATNHARGEALKILNRLGDLAAAVQRLQDALNELQGHLEAAASDDEDAGAGEAEPTESTTIPIEGAEGDLGDAADDEEVSDEDDEVEDVEFLRAYA